MAKSIQTVAMAANEAKWRAESDLRTLIEARAIKADKKRHAAAVALAKQQMTDVAAVASTDNDGDD